jgi:methyl-accepting chemotaxis protein
MTDFLTHDGLSSGWLLITVLCLVLVMLPFTVVAVRGRKTNQQFSAAVQNMSQGLCMFDAEGRIVLCNRRYLAMYHLSPDVVKPGCTLRALIEHRKETGLFTGDPEQYCRDIFDNIATGQPSSWFIEAGDGRIVHAVNQPTGDGGWVATHEDVTEQLRLQTERDEMAAREGRRTSIEGTISAFRERIDQLLKTVGQSAAALRATATHLSGSSDQTAQHAQTAVQASDEAYISVRSAAIATEELAGSIAEIARQVDQTNTIVRGAVSEAETTDVEIAKLADAARTIGDVVGLIRDIAGQTNLLALNATIEAARAGEAGRGFAVVASEVKSLAVQTATATGEISDQILAVQASTTTAVEAIRRISERMHEVSRYTSSVAASVEQQNAATGQISGSVTNAAEGTNTVVSVFDKVAVSVNETRGSAQTVMEAAQAVEATVGELRREVEGFLGQVAA